MKALLLITLSLFVGVVHADFGSSTSRIGKMDYMQVLPGLRGMARSLEGEKLIEKMNDAYKELKAQGNDNPSAVAVAERFEAKNGLPEVGGQEAELGTICVIAIVSGLAAGGTYVMSNPNLRRIVSTVNGDGSSCPKKTSQLIESGKSQESGSVLSGSST